ncbi:MAG: hypothetical protein ACRD94_04280, partial [Nitrosopumilaceae archaeon]
MVSRDKLEKILMFSVLFIISSALLFPLGDAKADNIVAIDADKTITFEALSSGSVIYKLEATSAIGDASGCNATGPNPVIVTLTLPFGLTTTGNPMSFTNCKQQRTVTFTSSTADTYVVLAVATGGIPESAYQTESATMTVIVTQTDTTPPVVTVPP